VQNLSYENEFDLHENAWFRTKTPFDRGKKQLENCLYGSLYIFQEYDETGGGGGNT